MKTAKDKEKVGKLLKDVADFSNFLAEKYRLKRVYLFGSLSEGLFLKGSDVDIAVEGMDFQDYLKALAEFRYIDGVLVDIVHLDFCKPDLRQAILENKGVKILYE
ncbi:MAG: nucleotidyltransferase domain-containing protein [Candidatus Omnitrophota bacterium]